MQLEDLIMGRDTSNIHSLRRSRPNGLNIQISKEFDDEEIGDFGEIDSENLQ